MPLPLWFHISIVSVFRISIVPRQRLEVVGLDTGSSDQFPVAFDAEGLALQNGPNPSANITVGESIDLP